MKLHNFLLIASILLIVIFPIAVVSNNSLSYYIGVMVIVGIYAMVTASLAILVGYAGQISLGHAAFFGIGAYSAGVLTTRFGINPWIALLVGAALSMLVAYLIGLPSLKLKGHYLAMATLAFGIIVDIVFNEQGSLTGGPSGLTGIPGISIFNFRFNSDLKYYFLVYSALMLELIFLHNIINSRVGRALKTIRDNEDAANATGIAVYKYKLKIFIISALFASVAGSLYAYYVNFIDPSSFGFFPSVKFLIMIIIGGMSSLWGTVLGTGLMTFLDVEWLASLGNYSELIYGVVLLLLLMFLPNGIGGLFEKKRSKVIKKDSIIG